MAIHGRFGTAYGWVQLIIENVLLAALSAALSLPASAWAMRSVVAALQRISLSVPPARMDAGLMFFAFAIAVGTGVLFGLVPLWVLGDGIDGGNPLPTGAGRSKEAWVNMLGVAIPVSITLDYAPQTPAASAEFYRDVLGMEIVGGTGPDRPLGASAFLCYTRPCPSPLNILKLIICGPIQLFPLLPTVCPDEGRLKPSRHRLPDCPLFCWHS
jgi:hypothetical protein